MKKAIILLFMALVLVGAWKIKEAKATSHEDLFQEWEDQFQDIICPECQEPTPEPTPEPCPEPEPTPDPTPEPEPCPEPEPTPDPTPEPEIHVYIKHEHKKDSSCDGSIGNLVWNDENGNGIKDNGEKGISDVKMTLKLDGEEEDTTHTDKNGRYEFDDLCEGDYSVYVKSSDVSGYTQTYDPDGTLNGKTDVSLDGNNDDHTKADFGYAHRSTPATGSGTVAIFVAGALSLLSFVTFKQLRRKLY